MTPLSPTERRALKARAHALKPLVQVGGKGLTDAVVAEVERALAAHELIKVRAPDMDRDGRALPRAIGAERAGDDHPAVEERQAPDQRADHRAPHTRLASRLSFRRVSARGAWGAQAARRARAPAAVPNPPSALSLIHI